MGFFRRGNKKEKEEFGRNVILTSVASQSQARAMKLANKQQLDSLGRAYYLQQDENVMNILIQYCPYLVPAFSRLNATSQIKTEKDRRLMQLYFEDLLLHLEMELAEDGDAEARALIQALKINAEYRILDAIEGYRGKLVTEEIERQKIQVEQPEKKGIL